MLLIVAVRRIEAIRPRCLGLCTLSSLSLVLVIMLRSTLVDMVRWPSGLRRQTKDLVRKGVGSNPTLVMSFCRRPLSCPALVITTLYPTRVDKIHIARHTSTTGPMSPLRYPVNSGSHVPRSHNAQLPIGMQGQN